MNSALVAILVVAFLFVSSAASQVPGLPRLLGGPSGAPADAADAGLTVALEFARVQQMHAELQVAQAVQARTSARSGRDAWNESLARMDQEIERVRPHQQLKEQDLLLIRQQSEAAANRVGLIRATLQVLCKPGRRHCRMVNFGQILCRKTRAA